MAKEQSPRRSRSAVCREWRRRWALLAVAIIGQGIPGPGSLSLDQRAFLEGSNTGGGALAASRSALSRRSPLLAACFVSDLSTNQRGCRPRPHAQGVSVASRGGSRPSGAGGVGEVGGIPWPTRGEAVVRNSRRHRCPQPGRRSLQLAWRRALAGDGQARGCPGPQLPANRREG